jgi:hypothetical protein
MLQPWLRLQVFTMAISFFRLHTADKDRQHV